METFGILLVALGAFLVDSAVQNRAPVDLLKDIIKNPTQARSAFSQSKGTGYTSTRQGGATGSGTASQTAFGSAASGPAATAIAFARAQIGKPYVWGATGPNAYDCSGLVQAAWKAAGYNLTRTTYTMLVQPGLSKVSKDELIPGDLVFPDAGHVQIYTGNGMVVEAPRTGLNVREVAMWGFMTARRIPSNQAASQGKVSA